MSNRGGKRPGSGRPKSGLSRRIDVMQKLADANFCPFEAMIDIAQQAKGEGDQKLYYDVAKELAKYTAPQIRSIEVAGNDGGPVAITQVNLRAPELDENGRARH